MSSPRPVLALMMSLLAIWHGSHVTNAEFKTRHPWCYNGHQHFDTLSEGKKYLGLGESEGFTEAHLDQKINDTLHRVQCQLVDGPGGIDCCASLKASDIYNVLDVTSGSALSREDYDKSSTIIITWAHQLEAKCNQSQHIDWSALDYHDFFHELIESFHDDHDHHDDDDDDHHDDQDDDEGHGEEYFTAVALEKLVRAIDEHYRPGDDIGLNKTAVCSSDDAFYVMSREIWRDIHIHHPEHGIEEDEIGEMSAVLILYMLHGYCFKMDPVVEGLPPSDHFIRELFHHYGDEETCTIDEHGFEELLSDLGIEDDHDDHGGHAHSADDEDHDDEHDDDDHDDHDHGGPYGLPLSEWCLDPHDLQETFGLDLHDHNLTREDFLAMSPALLQQSVQGCRHTAHSEGTRPSDAQKYGYGFLTVLIISFMALLGLVVVRWRHTSAYKYLITAMLGLAAGTLIGDSLLHLVPHSIGLHDHGEDEHAHSTDISQLTVEPYIWKMLCACASVWFFFLLQLALMEANQIYGKKKITEEPITLEVSNTYKSSGSVEGQSNPGFSPDEKHGDPEVAKVNPEVTGGMANGLHSTTKQGSPALDKDISFGSETDLKANTPTEVAWMAVVGDAVHNLADGLTIGAAFSADLAVGISASIAVLCHEIPHEFGDIAIMLSAGWSIKKVALMQIISASFAFVGLFIGIPVSANDEARDWIFIIAAGMFLYVAMCNVMPELIQLYQEHKKFSILIVANVGFVLGVIFMLLIAIFEEYIRV